MGEAWDELAAFRARRGECAEEVAKLKSKCAQEHPQHKHVLECRECYPQIINRMRSWYLDTTNQEWFCGREVFLGELKALFAAALDHAVGLEEIDARIDAERRKWYQEQIKSSPSIRKSLEELTDHKEVLAKVGSGAPFEDLLEAMEVALESASSREDAKKSLDRLIVANSPEERYQLYKETFFQSSSDEHVSEKTQLYADRLQTGATMDEIVNKISLDRRSSIGASDQKERNRKRIDELRRARAAHELQKSKKASGRKDSTQKPQPPNEMNSTKKVMDAQVAITAHKSPTRTSIWTWTAGVYFCAGNALISTRLNPSSVPYGAQMSTSGVIEKKDIDDIVFDGEDRSRYRARDIKSHVVPLDDMLEDFAQKNRINIH
ncbi:hypothetical protein diail_8935 [Diaporthe ilicicola]|nr:hypothetical protein diail_8935 [Diaporthe ilicicola]